jgi:hypothetical protein
MEIDGLWVCRDCGAKLVTTPIGESVMGELPQQLEALVGKSAGAICLTLNLPHEAPYQSLVDHADLLHSNYMSAWSFVTQWLDGRTIWRDEDGSAVAVVTPDGQLHIEP